MTYSAVMELVNWPIIIIIVFQYILGYFIDMQVRRLVESGERARIIS